MVEVSRRGRAGQTLCDDSCRAVRQPRLDGKTAILHHGIGSATMDSRRCVHGWTANSGKERRFGDSRHYHEGNVHAQKCPFEISVSIRTAGSGKPTAASPLSKGGKGGK